LHPNLPEGGFMEPVIWVLVGVVGVLLLVFLFRSARRPSTAPPRRGWGWRRRPYSLQHPTSVGGC
jgi:hypothetical protein